MNLLRVGLLAGMLLLPNGAAAQEGYEGEIFAAAARHGVSGDWLVQIMYCESQGDPNAVGPHGEIGLFQWMPSTWYAWGGGDIWSPAEQIEMTAWAFGQGLWHHWTCAGGVGS